MANRTGGKHLLTVDLTTDAPLALCDCGWLWAVPYFDDETQAALVERAADRHGEHVLRARREERVR